MVTLSTSMISRPTTDVQALTEGKSAKAAQCITTTILRAQRLLADGYSVTPTDRSLVYEVLKPAQLMKRTGELREFAPYVVDAAAGTCTCEMFAREGICKHERAVRTAVADAMALLVPAHAPVAPAVEIVTCPLCQGDGARRIWQMCGECGGRAEVQVATGEDRYGYPLWQWQWCSSCEGRGGEDVSWRCGHCEGTGTVEHTGGATSAERRIDPSSHGLRGQN